MQIRDVVLEKEKTLANSDTTTIPLDIVDPITEIDIKFLAQNGNSGNDENPIARNVTKIEVVDGGKAYVSLDGEELLALYRASVGRLAPDYRSEWDNVYPYQVFPLQFGRFFGDQQYSFNPVALRNPQLKITHDLSKVRTVAADSFATGTGRLSVIARIMEGVPAASEMLAGMTISAWTSAGTGDKRISLPKDYPYRFLLVRSFYADSAPGTNITRLKMTCDTDKFVPFDMEDNELEILEASHYDMVERIMEVLPCGAELKDTHLGNCREVVICPNNTESFMAALIYNRTSAYCQGYSAILTALAVDKGANLKCKGYQPENAFIIPFGLRNEPDTWFSVRGYDKIEVVSTEAVASENSVALQQLIPCPIPG